MLESMWELVDGPRKNSLAAVDLELYSLKYIQIAEAKTSAVEKMLAARVSRPYLLSSPAFRGW